MQMYKKNVAKFDLMNSVVVNGVVLTFKQKRRKYLALIVSIWFDFFFFFYLLNLFAYI